MRKALYYSSNKARNSQSFTAAMSTAHAHVIHPVWEVSQLAKKLVNLLTVLSRKTCEHKTLVTESSSVVMLA